MKLAADVVILGGGGSGLAAACRAAERNLRVVVVERRGEVGGTTTLSVGSICASGTRLQRKAGVRDTIDAFIEDMAAFVPQLAAADAPHLRAMLAVEAGPTVAWLERLGVPFAGPFPEPPHRVPRMHNVVPSSRMYIDRLRAGARRGGVKILLGAEVDEICRDDQGRIVGVTGTTQGGTFDVRASRGVIIATGDFSGSEPLRKRWLPEAATTAVPVNPESRGDGHVLAEQLGAGLRNMDSVFGPQLRFDRAPTGDVSTWMPTWSWSARIGAGVVSRAPTAALRPLLRKLLVTHMSPSAELFAQGAILVNQMGDRFCDERSSVTSLSGQPEATGYIVLDQRLARQFSSDPYFISTAPAVSYAFFQDYQKARPDLVSEAATAHELATQIGADPQRLAEAVKSADPALTGQLYSLGPVRAMLTVTEGGIATSARLEVLDTAGAVIQGLYAAGGAGQGGMHLGGHGMHIGWALTSGRVAAESCARAIPVGPFPFDDRTSQ